MDKKRTLIVKHPRLRKIRNTLRIAIVDAVLEKIEELREEVREIPVREGEKRIPLIRKGQALEKALKESVCFCPICHSQTSDMIFNTHNNTWFCIECYEEQHEWYKTHLHSTERRNAPNPFP